MQNLSSFYNVFSAREKNTLEKIQLSQIFLSLIFGLDAAGSVLTTWLISWLMGVVRGCLWAPSPAVGKNQKALSTGQGESITSL